MATYRQASKKGSRKTKRIYTNTPNLQNCPQKRGQCVRVGTIKPKKPNSSQRKLAKVKLTNKKHVLAAIPGQQHNLQEYSTVLIRGGRVRDLPGVHYKVIRGVYDFQSKESILRMQGRSKYGLKKIRKEELVELNTE